MRRFVVLGEAAFDLLEVEAQSSDRSAKADRAELVGVGVDPFGVDVKDACHMRGVDVANGAGRGGLAQQLGDALCDRLDVVAVEAHAGMSCGGSSAWSAQWLMRVRAIVT